MEDSNNYRQETLLTIVFTPLQEGYIATIEELPEVSAQGSTFAEVKRKLGIALNKIMPGRAPYGIKPVDRFKYVFKTLMHAE